MSPMRDVKAMMKGVSFRPVHFAGTTRTVAKIKCAHPTCTEQHEVMQRSERHSPEFLIRAVESHGWLHNKGRYFCPAHED